MLVRGVQAQGGGSLSDPLDQNLRHKRTVFWIAALVSALLDLVSKHYAFAYLDAIPGSGARMTGFFSLTQHVNRGMVWGIAGEWRVLVVAFTSLLVPIIVLVAYSCREPRAPLWSLGILLGGAVGNLYDRVLFQHPHLGRGVRDFLQVDLGVWPANPWPAFNVADAAIVGGVGIFVLWSMFLAPPEAEKKGEQKSDQAPVPSPAKQGSA